LQLGKVMNDTEGEKVEQKTRRPEFGERANVRGLQGKRTLWGGREVGGNPERVFGRTLPPPEDWRGMQVGGFNFGEARRRMLEAWPRRKKTLEAGGGELRWKSTETNWENPPKGKKRRGTPRIKKPFLESNGRRRQKRKKEKKKERATRLRGGFARRKTREANASSKGKKYRKGLETQEGKRKFKEEVSSPCLAKREGKGGVQGR